MVKKIFNVFILILLFRAIALASDRVDNHFCNVIERGAIGNGIDYNTEIIQSVIDSMSVRGGGTIYFPPGVYLTKTIVLKDRITLFIDNGATILGSTGMTEFKPEYGSFIDSGGRQFGTTLIFAKSAKHISIRGDGVIDGQGFEKYYPKKNGVARPSIIRFIDCQDIQIEGITLTNSAAWVQHYIACDDLRISGITVRSYSNKNNDGLDIEGCQRVIITECNIDSEDDSIVMKTLTRRPCKDIVISNCIISGLKSAIKIGTETAGDFRNISISNCTFYGTRGLTFYTVDGGTVDNVTVSNISMRDTYGVICLRLGNRMRPYAIGESDRPKNPGKLMNISFSDIQAIGVTESNCYISGIPGYDIENITLNNIQITYNGGGLKKSSEQAIPELSDEYPKPRMFGTLPASGFYIRHAKNVKFDNVFFNYVKPDCRSVIVCDNVENAELSGLKATGYLNAAPFIWLKNSKEFLIRNCKTLNPVDTFLRVDGSFSSDIYLIQNRTSQSKKAVETDSLISADRIMSYLNY